MRIAWSDESAQRITGSVNEMRRQLELCVHQSRTAFNALEEANPDGSNKRLKAIESQMERVVGKLRNAMDDAMEMERNMKRMTMLFEEAEAEARRQLEGMEIGGDAERTGGPTGIIPVRRVTIEIPIVLPKPLIAPAPRINPIGPTPQWLIGLIQKKANTLLK